MRLSKLLLLSSLLAVGTTISRSATAANSFEIGIGAGAVYHHLIANVTQYIGDCTGYSSLPVRKNERLLVPIKDLGQNAPLPEKGRRVRIINRSNGGAYTDRKWDQAANVYMGFAESQPFHLTIGGSHQTKNMVLSPGNNDLIAVFYEGEFGASSFKELGIAEFSIQAEIKLSQKEVQRQWSDPLIECVDNPHLRNSAITATNCPGAKQRVQYLSCPSWTSGGLPKERKVLETLGSYSPGATQGVPHQPTTDYSSTLPNQGQVQGEQPVDEQIGNQQELTKG